MKTQEGTSQVLGLEVMVILREVTVVAGIAAKIANMVVDVQIAITLKNCLLGVIQLRNRNS